MLSLYGLMTFGAGDINFVSTRPSKSRVMGFVMMHYMSSSGFESDSRFLLSVMYVIVRCTVEPRSTSAPLCEQLAL